MRIGACRALAAVVGLACCLGAANAAPPSTTGEYQYFHFKEQRFQTVDRSMVALELPRGTTIAQVASLLTKNGLDAAGAKPSPIAGWTLVPTLPGFNSPAAIEAAVQALAADPSISFASPVFSGDEGLPYWPTRFLMVEFGDNANASSRQTLLNQVGAKSPDFRWSIMPNAARVELTTKNGFEALDASNQLAVANATTYAEVDSIITGKHNLIPNDTFFGNLWGIHNTGQAGGVADQDMDGVEAWDITTGSNAVITIIMDVGVQQGHPDLNSAPGNDFTGNGSGGEPINACDNHGTAVASCISGRINNALGIAGIAPATRTASTNIGVSSLACNGTWSGFLSWSADAINWGVGIGARVSNNSNSYGGTSAAVETAYLNSHNANNMVHFASAGNSGAGSIAYPSSIPVVNSVAALNRTGARAGFSQFGPGLDFSAPGQSIDACDRTGGNGYVAGDYVTVDGTSFASPYAAGVAALIVSRNPALTSTQVETIMQNTAVDLGAAGYDTGFGWGFVNANNAVIAAAPPPGNDTCGGATPIGLGTTTGNNANATLDAGWTCGFNVGKDVHFIFTPSCSATYRFDTCGTTWDTVLAIHTACPATTANSIACNDDNGIGACPGNVLASRIEIALTAGTTYFITLASFNNNAGGAYNLAVSKLDNFPANDACAAAIAMTDGVDYTGDTACASNDGTSNCGGTTNSLDVWYSYTPTCGGTYTFESCGSAYDTVLSLHSACTGSSANTIVCNDDSCGLQSRVSAVLTAGTTYRLRVGGFAGIRSGPYTVRVIRGADTFPANDNCANSIDVSAGGVFNGTLVCATNDSNAGSCGASTTNPDVWYAYTNPTCNPRRLLVTGCGSNNLSGVDTVISILSGCGGTELACSDDSFNVCAPNSGTLDSAVSAVVNPGETVKIRVSKFGTRIIAPFVINVSSTIANDTCADALLVPAGTYSWCNNGAATDGPLSCGGLGSDLWFRYTATAAGVVTVTTCGSIFDTVSAVYPDGCPAASEIACNDDDFNVHCGSGNIRDSWLQFSASAGNTYLVRVGGFASTQGSGSLTISLVPSGCYGACVSDFDDGSGTGTPDGGTTIDDLLYYLAIFEAGDICADVDDGSGTNTLDGGVTIDDLLYYLQRFEVGC